MYVCDCLKPSWGVYFLKQPLDPINSKKKRTSAWLKPGISRLCMSLSRMGVVMCVCVFVCVCVCVCFVYNVCRLVPP